jgi:hypothetical protein
MISTLSFTPFSSTAWLLSGMPARVSWSQALSRLARALARMVEVDVDPERVVLLRASSQSSSSTRCGSETGMRRSDADDLEVRDGAQLREDASRAWRSSR